MSWDDNADLPFPLPAGWVDAWTKLRPLDAYSWTYDSFWADKAEEFNGYIAFSTMKKPSDRFVCRLRDYTLKTIELIGDEKVGISYAKKYDGHYNNFVHLMPSCHRGFTSPTVELLGHFDMGTPYKLKFQCILEKCLKRHTF